MFNFETGWVAKISEEFTFENVRRAAREILSAVKEGSLIVGYDSRFLAEKFADEVVKIAEAEGFGCYLVERDTPTPVIAWEVRDKGAAGAIMVTAGGMPADFCGIKFIKGQGPKDSESLRTPRRTRGKVGVERFEPRERYIKYITSVDDWTNIRRAKPRVVVDPMFGAGRGYLDKILQELGCFVEEIHNYRDVLFGGKSPDPIEENLEELKAKMVELKADIGIALNGDVTAFALVDCDGKYSRPEPGSDAILTCLKML